MFTVSGAPSGSKLDGWIANSNLPSKFISQMYHIALLGRQRPEELTWYDRMMLKIGGMRNPDPVAKKEELEEFDYMDKTSIQPIVELIHKFQSNEVLA